MAAPWGMAGGKGRVSFVNGQMRGWGGGGVGEYILKDLNPQLCPVGRFFFPSAG